MVGGGDGAAAAVTSDGDDDSKEESRVVPVGGIETTIPIKNWTHSGVLGADVEKRRFVTN